MCHESARHMSYAAVSQTHRNAVVLAVTSVTLRPPSARRALVVHFSAGRSQRPLGVTVEDSPVPALLFSGCLRARVGRVRLDWPSLRRRILSRLTATGCGGGKSRLEWDHEARQFWRLRVWRIGGFALFFTLSWSYSLSFSSLLASTVPSVLSFSPLLSHELGPGGRVSRTNRKV